MLDLWGKPLRNSVFDGKNTTDEKQRKAGDREVEGWSFTPALPSYGTWKHIGEKFRGKEKFGEKITAIERERERGIDRRQCQMKILETLAHS